ncbi:MAG: hypothetical protein Q8S73_21525, partial [Deltaproteobacteria bacterium]|nr:hypothetical protein [Deltaproteobacteria bacterium]
MKSGVGLCWLGVVAFAVGCGEASVPGDAAFEADAGIGEKDVTAVDAGDDDAPPPPDAVDASGRDVVGRDAPDVAAPRDAAVVRDAGCVSGAREACFTGPAASRGVGACRDGQRSCAAGAWSPCVAEIVPRPETCGGQDLDCDGVVGGPAADATCRLDHATAVCRAGACAVATCEASRGDCDANAANGCEADLRSDAEHCGGCAVACAAGANEVARCVAGACAVACVAGTTDCDGMRANGCESALDSDPANCGACGRRCPATAPVCGSGVCGGAPFTSDGSDGPFDPAMDVTLDARVYQFTTVNIRSGVTVRTNGTATLELRAQGSVVIAGTLSARGGTGGSGAATAGGGCNAANGEGGGVGTDLVGARGNATRCLGAGAGGSGVAGTNGMTNPTGCGLGGSFGGGAGGAGHHPGGGGGGYAGGGGGGSTTGIGGYGASSGAGVGGFGGAPRSGAGAGGDRDLRTMGYPTFPLAGYAGRDGTGGNYSFAIAGAGAGGGAIGLDAVQDLAVATTFRPGSGGGGGGG